MPLLPFHGVWPTLSEDVFIAPGAMIIGDVHLGPGVSVWYNAVVRADFAPITIGARSNVQDNAVIHVDDGAPCTIGEDCIIGHSAIVHGAQIGNRVLIAMHATVLSHATIGDDVILAANAMLPEKKSVPSNALSLGAPAHVARELTDADRERVRLNAVVYSALAQEHRTSLQEAGVLLDGGQLH
jgi:gamma-carbonic anhydrase